QEHDEHGDHRLQNSGAQLDQVRDQGAFGELLLFLVVRHAAHLAPLDSRIRPASASAAAPSSAAAGGLSIAGSPPGADSGRADGGGFSVAAASDGAASGRTADMEEVGLLAGDASAVSGAFSKLPGDDAPDGALVSPVAVSDGVLFRASGARCVGVPDEACGFFFCWFL